MIGGARFCSHGCAQRQLHEDGAARSSARQMRRVNQPSKKSQGALDIAPSLPTSPLTAPLNTSSSSSSSSESDRQNRHPSSPLTPELQEPSIRTPPPLLSSSSSFSSTSLLPSPPSTSSSSSKRSRKGVTVTCVNCECLISPTPRTSYAVGANPLSIVLGRIAKSSWLGRSVV